MQIESSFEVPTTVTQLRANKWNSILYFMARDLKRIRNFTDNGFIKTLSDTAHHVNWNHSRKSNGLRDEEYLFMFLDDTRITLHIQSNGTQGRLENHIELTGVSVDIKGTKVFPLLPVEQTESVEHTLETMYGWLTDLNIQIALKG